MICMHLVPQMCAAESDCDVGEHSDVWGIGCRIYHMFKGVHIYHSFRHLSHNEIPSKVLLSAFTLAYYIGLHAHTSVEPSF